jgi:hypothetical protein
MATVVIDNADVGAVLADARGEKVEPVKADTKEAKADDKAADNTDDVEDENGVTPAQKREFTAKMLAAIGKKHRQMMEAKESAATIVKSAEDFAAEQYNEKRLAEQRAENLERELQRLKNAQIKVEVKEATEPKRKDFKTDDEFRDAAIDWKVDQKLQAKQREDQQREDERRQQQVLEAANSRIARAIETVPDFKAVTEACDWETPPYIASYMQESEMFGELGYFLAKPEQAELRAKLSKMRPEAALVEIGKIESKLSPFAAAKANGNGSDNSKSNGSTPSTDASQASSTDSGQSKSRAAVIKPLSSGSAVQVEKDEAEMSPQEALAAWQKKHGVNLQARKRH